ncbi:MAG TPA: NUDIX hydrolase, partial [Anaerolineae bacterium]|nr:NUDIX hydrolase [Anaerolineae bacterium]
PERLVQLQAFGDPGRDPRGWTVSVVHLAVVTEEEARSFQPKAADDAADVAWFDLDDLPALAFDHAQILAAARARLTGA